jgi:hypothetical protein
VTLNLDPGSDALGDNAMGVLEVHQGGILATPFLRSGRSYRFIRADGQECPIRLARIQASDSAGIARMDFRVGVR